MFRFALNDLKAWLEHQNRKPLVIRGARQVGKTWLVREFARLNNMDLIEINFELEPEKKALFEENHPEKILTSLEINLGRQLEIKQTLLFLDEIQEFPSMLAKLRWFKELMPKLAVIVTGSLLEFVLDKHEFSMPVGRISYFNLEPLSFDEFLHTRNPQLLTFLKNYHWEEIPSGIHNSALMLLKEYTVVGGLPAAISCWLEQQSLLAVHQVQNDILTTYRDDFIRYKGKYSIELFDAIFNYIPRNIGKKIVYSHIRSDTQISAIKQVLALITKARVMHNIKASAANGIPLSAEIKNKKNKAITLDIGIMNSTLGINLNDFKTVSDIDYINKGAITEQIVGQLLRTIEPFYIEPSLFYWLRNQENSNAKIDYIIQHKTKIIPIEVKAGAAGSMQSLHLFMKLKKLNTAVKISTAIPSKMLIDTKTSTGDNVKYQLLSLPIYMIGQLKRLLDEHIKSDL